MRDGLSAWSGSGVTEAPLLELAAEAESLPGERLAPLTFSARRARFASRALLSASCWRSACCTAVRRGDWAKAVVSTSGAGGGERPRTTRRRSTRVHPSSASLPA